MSESTQRRLRKLIQEIRGDEKLSQDEKNKAIQRVMQSQQRITVSSSGLATEASSPLSTAAVDRQIMKPNTDKECKHYVKNCSRFYFTCCDTIDPCHRCHLDRGCEVKPPQIATISCNTCGTRQVPGTVCLNAACRAALSTSHCSVCMIWTQSEITHCVGCGLCRVGTADSLFHCDTCEACYHIAFKGKHKCVKTSMKDQFCPLCLEPTHSSQKRCDILRCGHIAHFDCLRASWKHGQYGMVPRCPSCRKSLFPPEALLPYWEAIRTSIRLQPLTSEILAVRAGDTVTSPYGKFCIEVMFHAERNARFRLFANDAPTMMCRGRLIDWKLADGKAPVATIQLAALKKEIKVAAFCNDCEKKCMSDFHFLGLECAYCKGFNTARA